jgi:hypothetical protein
MPDTYKQSDGLKNAKQALRNKVRRQTTARSHLHGDISPNSTRKKSVSSNRKKKSASNVNSSQQLRAGDETTTNAEAST